MGCFFSCLRINDGRHSQIHLVTNSISSKQKDRSLSPRSLSNHRLTEVKNRSPYKDKENSFSRFLQQGIDDDIDLKAEAGPLKPCFTSPESQNEIGKEMNKHEDSLLGTPDSKPLPTRIQVSERGIPDEQIPGVSVDCSGGESEAAPGSFKTKDVNVTKEHPTGLLISTEDTITDTVSRNKSVHFKHKDDTGSDQNVSEDESLGKTESCPTPLSITDEMQTPGTAFPANLDEIGTAKNPRIRSQYVYTVDNCGREDNHQVSELFDHVSNLTPQSMMEKLNSDKELKVEESLSAWFKPVAINPSKRDYNGISHGDRPIIGMVAAHWNKDETGEISAKPWDGKGIPNSTTKYKEDQKIYYHATPFEERLEKALSDETLISKKKIVHQMLPVSFEECEESDTAMSQLQPSSLQPVASF